MAIPIAQLFVSVSADVGAAINGLTSLEGQLNKTATSFQQAAPAALLFAGAGAAITGGLTSAVNVAADFEKQMSSVRSVMSPAEANQFGQALSELAIRLGRDTVFTSREAAAGIEELIKAGIPAENVINGAADAAINLAAATGINVADAAAIAAQAMNAFGITASNVNGAVDTLAGVVNASAASMSDLRFGLQVVAPTAHSLGLSFEDTAKAIGLLTNAGETGQVAGTGLRQMLLELTPTTKPATEEMKKLGLITAQGKNQFFDATGKLKSMAEISQILQNALRGMSAEQRTAALNTLFTRDAINSASILADDGSAAFDRLAGAMEGITAASTAQTRLQGLRGALQNLGGSVETVQIIVGNLLLPVLTDLANNVRSVIDRFSNLDPRIQRSLVVITAIAGAVLAGVGAFILLAPAIAAVGPALGAVISVFSALAPIIAIGIGLFFALRAAWENDFAGIQEIAANFSNIGDIIQAALAGEVGPAFEGLVEDFARISPQFRTFIDMVRGEMVPSISEFASAIATEFGPVATELATTTLPALIQAGIDLINLYLTPAKLAFEALTSNTAIEFFSALLNVITELVSIGATALQGLFQNVLVPGFQALSEALGPTVTAAIQGTADALGPLATNLGLVRDGISPLQAFFEGATQALRDFAATLNTVQLPAFLTPGTGSVIGSPTEAAAGIQGAAATAAGGAQGAAAPLIGIGQLIISSEAEATAFLDRMGQAIATAAKRASTPTDNSANPALAVGT